MIEYKEFGVEEIERVKEIYVAECWSAYLNDDEALNFLPRCLLSGETCGFCKMCG